MSHSMTSGLDSQTMRVLCIESACVSYEKRDQFLQLLSNIAVVTRENEPKTLAYCWLKRSKDCAAVPGQYVCGFEVYEDETSSKVTHRSSQPYKKMRSILGAEQIQERPTDLSYCRPTGVGFLTRDGKSTVFQGSFPVPDEKDLVEVWELTPKDGMKTELLSEIENLATYVEREVEQSSTFWVLEFLAEYANDNLKVVSRFENQMTYESYMNSELVKDFRARITGKAISVKLTTWEESGIGFIGR